IRLVDVQSRTIVRYPVRGRVDYVALTYAWWASRQRERYRVGSVVQNPPKTIEDAIKVTADLGKRFLWVDSLCIDQGDESHKQEQIQMMASIYSGVGNHCCPKRARH
ncbi:heterokaryon incompatibility protein-domain-containing protein, partial [Lasiosphaeris hirsuta]